MNLQNAADLAFAILASSLFAISSAQAQPSTEATAAVVVTYLAAPGLMYDRCAKVGFFDALQPSAEERFENYLRKAELEPPNDPRIPADEYKKTMIGMREGWERLKPLIAEIPDSNFTQERCSKAKVEFQKNRKSFPDPK